MSILNMNRRSFLYSTSMVAVSSIPLFDKVMAKAADPVIAETIFGKIRGVENRGIKIFKCIPYGADTSGKNRFMAPQDPDKWTGVRDALEFGHSAPQSAPPKPKDTNAPAPAPRPV